MKKFVKQYHSGSGDNVAGDKYEIIIESRSIPEAIKDFYFGIFKLIFNPEKSLIKINNTLYCESYSGFSYWIGTYLTFYVVGLFFSSNASHYSFWYFLLLLVYGGLRILLLSSIYYVISLIHRIDNPFDLVNANLFSTGLMTFLSIFPMLPFLYELGFERIIELNIGLGETGEIPNIEEYAHLGIYSLLLIIIAFSYFVFIFRIALFGTKVESRKIISIIIFSNVVYWILRPFTVTIAIEKLFYIIDNPPW